MPFEHRIDRCFVDGAVDRTTFEGLRRRTADGVQRLVAAQRDNSLPLLNLPARTDDLEPLGALARDLRARVADVVVLGIGGSSLGGETVLGLAAPASSSTDRVPRVHFMAN